MSKHALLRRVPLAALLLGALVVLGAGVAGAAPLGQITEFGASGTNPAQVVAGPDGTSGSATGTGRSGRSQRRDGHEVHQRPESGSAVRSIAMGTDGNMWFSDPGTTRAVGMINPTTHAISEFSLPAGSMPLGSLQARTGMSGSPIVAPRRRSG